MQHQRSPCFVLFSILAAIQRSSIASKVPRPAELEGWCIALLCKPVDGSLSCFQVRTNFFKG